MGVAQFANTYVDSTNTGETFLVVPGFYDRIQAHRIREVLNENLGDVLGHPYVQVEVTEAPRKSDGSGYADSGAIVIYGLREPWPDAQQLRDVIADAVEAGERAQEDAKRRAGELADHLEAVFRAQ